MKISSISILFLISNLLFLTSCVHYYHYSFNIENKTEEVIIVEVWLKNNYSPDSLKVDTLEVNQIKEIHTRGGGFCSKDYFPIDSLDFEHVFNSFKIMKTDSSFIHKDLIQNENWQYSIENRHGIYEFSVTHKDFMEQNE